MDTYVVAFDKSTVLIVFASRTPYARGRLRRGRFGAGERRRTRRRVRRWPQNARIAWDGRRKSDIPLGPSWSPFEQYGTLDS